MRVVALSFVVAGLSLSSQLVGARGLQDPHYQQPLKNTDGSGTEFSKGGEEGGTGCEMLGREKKIGVGIEFTSTYAIAVMKLENGTIVDLPKIENDVSYTSLTTHLSSPSAHQTIPNPPKPPCHSLPNFLSPISSFLGKAYNFFYPALVHPVSLVPSIPRLKNQDLHLLTTYLARLKATIESELRHCVINAPSSILIPPELVSLARSGTLGTAFAAVDMDLVRVDQGATQKVAAAWTGMGHNSGHAQDVKRTLAIEFSREMLVVSTADVQSSQDIPDMRSRGYLQLGYWMRDTFGGGEKGYWDTVKGVLMSAARNDEGEKVERVLIMGDCAGEKVFLDALWWVLSELGVSSLYGVFQVVGFDAERVVARGMAEMALRWEDEKS